MTLILFLLVGLIGGISGPLVKFTSFEFPPFILVALRAGLSTIILLAFFTRQKNSLINSNLIYLFLASLMFAANIIFFTLGIRYTSVIISQLLYVPTGLIVAVIGYLFLKEKLSKEQILGLLLSMTGISILSYGSFKTKDILSFGTPQGNILIGLAVLGTALFFTFSRKASQSYSPLTLTFFNFLTTTLVAVLFVPIDLINHKFNISNISYSGIFGLLALVIFSSVIVYYLYQVVISRTSAFVASLILYLTIIIASGIGIIYFGEKLNLSFILSGALIIIGVFMATTYQHVKGKLKI